MATESATPVTTPVAALPVIPMRELLPWAVFAFVIAVVETLLDLVAEGVLIANRVGNDQKPPMAYYLDDRRHDQRHPRPQGWLAHPSQDPRRHAP